MTVSVLLWPTVGFASCPQGARHGFTLWNALHAEQHAQCGVSALESAEWVSTPLGAWIWPHDTRLKERYFPHRLTPRGRHTHVRLGVLMAGALCYGMQRLSAGKVCAAGSFAK